MCLCVWLTTLPHLSPKSYHKIPRFSSLHQIPISGQHFVVSKPPRTTSKFRRRKKERFLKRTHSSVVISISMATAISATGFQGGLSSSFHGSWGKSIAGEDFPMLARTVAMGAGHVRVSRPIRSGPMMGNINEGKGIFAPLVVVTRNIIGKKRFNQLRGKAIALHSQVITEFCKTIGADAKQRQGLIRLAKKNGEKLGFLA